jgi:rubrerythrin
MRTAEEQALYEKKKHVALSNMGRRGGKRSVIRKMMDGTFERHMGWMTLRSAASRAQQKREKEEAKPFILRSNYRCPRCHHYWIGKKAIDPKQCPECGLRLAAKWVRQLNQASLRMYPAEMVQEEAKQKPKTPFF